MKSKNTSKKAVVLVSGGMDSLVSLAMANKIHGSNNIFMFHLNYGQKTENKELLCFKAIAKFYKIPINRQKIIDISFLKEIGGSSLTDKKMKVTNFKGHNLRTKDKNNIIPTSYVPFRNTIIISLAVAYAEVISANKIYIGAVDEDSSGYPDCRPSYYKAVNEVIKEGTKAKNIKVVTPVIDLLKDQIIKKGISLNAPFELSWSCYKSEKYACGVCDSCVLRLNAFRRAGFVDPINYK
ncbi:MAG: 7-cyano-7-deazaguanine synthase QueC [Oligoflexia bacterium]|nr:7-cyano-7-deazaguanine synthase QueC [Oligoflexia bacterium]